MKGFFSYPDAGSLFDCHNGRFGLCGWHQLCLRQRRLHLRAYAGCVDFIGRGFVGPIPFSVIIAALLFILLFVFLNYTVVGRNILATGGNPVAAKLTGIKISRYRLIGLIISGTCAGIAGIVLTSFLGTGQPNGADAYTMDALAAVFLGITTIRPGQANLMGTIVGVLILGILNNGLNLVGAPFYMQNIVRGGMLVLSVALAVYREEIRFF